MMIGFIILVTVVILAIVIASFVSRPNRKSMQSLARLTRQRLRLPWVRPWRAGAFAFLDFRGQFSIIYRAVGQCGDGRSQAFLPSELLVFFCAMGKQSFDVAIDDVRRRRNRRRFFEVRLREHATQFSMFSGWLFTADITLFNASFTGWFLLRGLTIGSAARKAGAFAPVAVD